MNLLLNNKKTVISIILAFAICICFGACSKDAQEQDTTAQTEPISSYLFTTQPRSTSTTAAVSSNEKKGQKLKNSIIKSLGNPKGAGVNGDIETGSFCYTFNTRSAADVYANEASDDMEQLAKKNADKFVDDIKSNYSDKITFEKAETQPITTTSENGVDSARYVVYYTNTQNQQLIVQTDSDAVISYIVCDFTW